MKKMVFLLALAGMFCLGGLARGADSLVLSDSEWTLYGSAKAKMGKYGSYSAKGLAFLHFYADGKVVISDQEGSFEGTYQQDIGGDCQISITPAEMASSIEAMLSDQYPSLASYISTPQIYSLQTQCKVVEKKGIVTVTVAIKSNMVFQIVVPQQGINETVKMSYSLAASGSHSNVLGEQAEGETWLINGTSNFKMSSCKKADTGSWKLMLGPQSGEGLAYNEFALYENTGSGYELMWQGLYYRSGNSLIFFPDEAEGWDLYTDWDWEEDWLDGLVQNSGLTWNGDFSGPSYSVFSCTAKIKNGKAGASLSLKSKIAFWYSLLEYEEDEDIDYDNWKDIKGSYSLSGIGTIAP